jgi:UTP--glucose-1-phosphate uridylyltransferase
MTVSGSLRPQELARLGALGFDADAFDRLVEDWRHGRLPPARVQGSVTPPAPHDLATVPPPGSWQGDALVDAGRQLIAQGKAAVALLNGGMATRFGGRVKGVVDALPGRSFLALQAQRLREARAELDASVPLLLMNSEATERETRAHLREREHFGLDPNDVRCFVQSAAPRLLLDGSLYRDERGDISIYGPGHGDFAPSLLRAGLLGELRERGVEYLLVGNIDNLGADLDPGILGHFAASGAALLVENAPKRADDVGGAPARVDGRLRLLEGFAFPDGFDHTTLPAFNTNTLWFRLDALDPRAPLQAYPVKKDAGGMEVIQFERLIGQHSWFMETVHLLVARGRFLPVKTPEDLELLRPELRKRFGVGLHVAR